MAVNSVINRKERFATEGIRFQRHNPDGTIPTPQRFLGFANTTDLTRVLENKSAPLTIKIDDAYPMAKAVDFSHAGNLARVTTEEAIDALNAAGFNDIEFSFDVKTGRIKGAYASGKKAAVSVEITNEIGNPVVIERGTYSFPFGNANFACVVEDNLTIDDSSSKTLQFEATKIGKLSVIPVKGNTIDLNTISPAIPNADNADLEGVFTEAANGENSELPGNVIQVTGPLAAALDFGNCLKFGGNGLEMISFFDDETISIGMPKDIKDKEEIDIEGANGTITRMVIGAMLQGMSPVVTFKVKDYFFVEMIQGGKLDRETGKYNPPRSHESDHPSVWAEMFSPVYSAGTNKKSDMAGFERILLRTMSGIEGDVPADAKAWAQYAYNLNATEYTDENGITYPAWEEQPISVTQFAALNVKQISMKAA